MNKKLMFIMMSVLLSTLVHNVLGDQHYWSNESDDSRWNTAGNWENNAVPTDIDDAYIDANNGYGSPTIDANHTGINKARCQKLYVYNSDLSHYLYIAGGILDVNQMVVIGTNLNRPGNIIVDGGIIDVNDGYNGIVVGFNAGSNGNLEINSGIVSAAKPNGAGIKCGLDGHGTITMNGGSVVAYKMRIPYYDSNDPNHITGSGEFHLNGGTLELTSTSNDSNDLYSLTINPNGSMDISGGTLILKGDRCQFINNYYEEGRITAFDGEGFIKATYDSEPNKTTVVARPFVLTFSDDFNGTAIDANKWANPHYMPGENRFRQNIDVNNGNLYVKCIENASWYENDWSYGTVGSKFYQKYGFFRASLKIGDHEGEPNKLNQAFWLYTPEFGSNPDEPCYPFSKQNDRIEIDIQEIYAPNLLRMGLYDWRPQRIHRGGERLRTPDDLRDGFHEYGLKWDPNNHCKWYYDRQNVNDTNFLEGRTDSVVDVLFSTADSCDMGDVNTAMQVDWVKVYEWPTYWDVGSYTFPTGVTGEGARRHTFTKNFVIMNDTSVPLDLDIDRITITGTDANQFNWTLNDDNNPIPQGKYRLLSVTFEPHNNTGVKSAVLTVYTNYNGTPTITTIDMTGTAKDANAAEPYPTDTATGLNRNIDLSWKKGFFAKDHCIYLGTDEQAVNNLSSAAYKGSQTTCSYDPGLLGYNTTYYWRIVEGDFYSGHTGNGHDPVYDQDINTAGPVWCFTIKQEPNAPPQAVYPSPASSAKYVSPFMTFLTWDEVADDANEYKVYFSSVRDEVEANNINAFKGTQSTIGYYTGTLEPSTTYYWRIDTKNRLGTKTGNIWSFTTGTANLIDPNKITATASDSNTNREPAYAVNGNGIDINGTAHESNVADYMMWMSHDRSPINKWFKVDLGASYNLDFMKIYNFNYKYYNKKYGWLSYLNRGCNQIDIYYSNSITDPHDPMNYDGWTSLGVPGVFHLTQAIDEPNYGTVYNTRTKRGLPDYVLLPGVTARWIFFKLNSNYGGCNYGLSEIQFFKKMANGISSPNPPNNGVDAAQIEYLTWTPGENSASYDVYFGTVEADVNDANQNSPQFKGNQTCTNFDPGSMEPNTTYYWRIDEYIGQNITPSKGDLWRFTTNDHIDPSAWIATASDTYSVGNAYRIPDLAIDGSGMNGNSHAADTAENQMWMSDANNPSSKWFKINLTTSCLLDSMKIWNFNWKDSIDCTNRGCKDVDVYYSNDVNDPCDPNKTPENWTLLESRRLTRASGRSDYGTNDQNSMPDKIDFNNILARWVALKIKNNYLSGSHNTTYYSGLSEIRLYESLVIPGKACGPNPPNSAVDAYLEQDLSWIAAENADANYYVYFGDNEANVAGADQTSQLLNDCSGTTFNPGIMEPNKTYYWRVDARHQIDANTTYTTKGDVWRFTTVPLIAPNTLTATASDFYDKGYRDPNHAVDGNGMTGLAHDNMVANGKMWMSSTDFNLPKWYKVKLDNKYDLYTLKIYNFNFRNSDINDYTGRGCKDVDIYYSYSPNDPCNPITKPKNWILLESRTLTKASGRSDYGTNDQNNMPDTIDFGGIPVRWVALKIKSNYLTVKGYTGLSELRFYGLRHLDAPKIDPNNIIATASDFYDEGFRDPNHAANGDGLAEDGLAHDCNANYMAWMTHYRQVPGSWFKLDLGAAYEIDFLKIWNFNYNNYTSRGSKDIRVYYSKLDTDPGNPRNNDSNWTGLADQFVLKQAPGTNDYGTTSSIKPDEIDMSGGIVARWICIDVNSAYESNYCGLSEVQCFGFKQSEN
jgi:hypothetical protein